MQLLYSPTPPSFEKKQSWKNATYISHMMMTFIKKLGANWHSAQFTSSSRLEPLRFFQQTVAVFRLSKILGWFPKASKCPHRKQLWRTRSGDRSKFFNPTLRWVITGFRGTLNHEFSRTLYHVYDHGVDIQLKFSFFFKISVKIKCADCFYVISTCLIKIWI